MPETRHYHGSIQHDHPGGNLPHDHRPGDPDWDTGFSGLPKGTPPRGDYFDRYLDRMERGTPSASAAFSFGTILLILGALGLLVTNNTHSECGSVLVQAVSQSQCQDVSYVWTIGLLGVVIGVVLLIVGAILRGKS